MTQEYDSLNLSPSLKDAAFQCFGETDMLRENSLKELRNLILALPEDERITDISDRSLIRFIRSRKYNLERALEFTVKYHEFQKKYAHLLNNFTADEIMVIKDMVMLIEEPEIFGKAILIVTPSRGFHHMTKERIRDNPHMTFRNNYFIFEELSHHPRVQICGLFAVTNFHGLSFWDQMTLSNMTPFSDHMATFNHFHALGVRLKGTFIIEQPTMLSWLWFLMRPFMSEKLQKRFHLCGTDLKILHEHLQDVSRLPRSLGGQIEDDNPSLTKWMEEKYQQLLSTRI